MSARTPPYMRLAYGLAIAAVFAAALAALAVFMSQERSKPAFMPELALPQLADQAQTVTGFVIRSGEVTLEIKLDPNVGWTLPSRDGYAAQFGKVNGLFRALAELQRMAPRSAHPKWHERLGVASSGDGGNGRYIEVLGADGDILASLIVGNAADFGAGEGMSYVYVREPNDDQVWLASTPGDLGELSANADDWLEKEIIDLPRDRIAKVEITPAGEASYTVSRTTPDETNFKIVGLPDGLKLKSDGAANGAASALAGLTLKDVSRADRIDFAEDDSRTVFTTFDGLVVAVDLVKLGEDTWIQLKPSVTAEADEAVQALADALGARLSPWIFQIDEWKGRQLTTALETLIEPETTREENGAETPAADSDPSEAGPAEDQSP